jgi:hypothetical protein
MANVATLKDKIKEVEQKLEELLDEARAVEKDMELPNSFWDEATACHDSLNNLHGSLRRIKSP